MKKRIIILCVILSAAIAISFIFYREEIIKSVFSGGARQIETVIVDAGHGGFDGGAVAPDGTAEKNINLEIAKSLRDFLTHFGFRVILSREGDFSTASEGARSQKSSDLKNRLALMSENPDSIFVSVHLNKFAEPSVHGAQVFYSAADERSLLLAESLQSVIKNFLEPENARAVKRAGKNIFILHNASVPAVIVECGFLSNKADLEKLKSEEYQRKMAFSIFCGIIDYYNGLGR